MRELTRINRRRLLAGSASALLLGGCDRLASDDRVRRTLAAEEELTRWAQNLIGSAEALAPEYTEVDLSPVFRGNGTTDPDSDEYLEMAEAHFAEWHLDVSGLVKRPARLSLDDLRALPSRTQITRHDCVEGWSCIGKWKGAMLSGLLAHVGVRPEARFVVFRCADALDSTDPENKYYESIDIAEALHPQTILAYEMNDQVLPVRHGAPLRLRVERQLGYKMAKYIMRIELVDRLDHIGSGHGGYWEDLGYDWYAGI
jgi:DMSO/TMAO reductase YedYZ molybdopterin-dependent catalytic subunit